MGVLLQAESVRRHRGAPLRGHQSVAEEGAAGEGEGGLAARDASRRRRIGKSGTTLIGLYPTMGILPRAESVHCNDGAPLRRRRGSRGRRGRRALRPSAASEESQEISKSDEWAPLERPSVSRVSWLRRGSRGAAHRAGELVDPAELS